MVEVRWHGRGGQGSFTASKLLGVAASLYGDKQTLAFPSFGPERRGAPVLAFTKIDQQKIRDRSEVIKCDYIVILDETLFNESFFKDLKPSGKIILNAEDPARYKHFDANRLYLVDASSAALAVLGKPITNTAMLGALVGLSDLTSLDSLLNGMGSFLKGSLLEKNKQLVRQVFEKTKEEVQ